MKKFLSIILVLVLCFSLVACGSGDDTTSSNATEATTQPTTAETTAPEKNDSDGSTPLLYKATSENGGEVWIFGSIHVGTDDMYPLPDYVTTAYNEADSLAVEIDVVGAMEDTGELISLYQKAMYLDGTTIKDHIPEDLYNDSVKILEDNDYYMDMLDYYTPGMWSSFVENFTYTKYGYDSEKGIDMHLLNLAKDNEKDIIEIETFESQMSLIVDIDEKLQVMLLESAVEDYDSEYSKEYLNELVSAWISGDEEKITEIIYEDADEEELADYTEEEIKLLEDYNTAMLTDRNILMTDFAENALKDGDSVFICVGTAHVVGDGAIVDLLRDRGYTVELVK